MNVQHATAGKGHGLLSKSQIPHDAVFVRTAVLEAIEEAKKANGFAESAVQKALFCGSLFLENKAAMAHGAWLPWLQKTCPDLSEDTAQRWMNAARNVIGGAGVAVKGLGMPLSQLLSMPVGELPVEAREARQLLFDFMEGKTIRDCLRGVLVNGDPGHRMDRAINGRTKGGFNGEDRKAYDEFIRKGLRVLGTHFAAHKNFTPGMWDVIGTEVERFCAGAPDRVVLMFRKSMKGLTTKNAKNTEKGV